VDFLPVWAKEMRCDFTKTVSMDFVHKESFATNDKIAICVKVPTIIQRYRKKHDVAKKMAITIALLFPKANCYCEQGRSSDFPISSAFPFSQWRRCLKH
jgi:hypothetical protein